ncbi:MAG: DUF4097 family beta strand repeat-containing protein [Deltaproteobacteria bacterium]|nr:DUF4097 family beta strand repeat-containing protein [Deltaproteobacteria bacterium]
MTLQNSHRRFRLESLHLPLLCIALTLTLTACQQVEGSLRDTETRTFTESFSLSGGEPLRLANLVGEVELIAGSGDEVVVEAEVHAAGKDSDQTQRLLDDMSWVEEKSRGGGKEWFLSYPVEEFKTFHFNRPKSGWGYNSSIRYRGRKIKVTSRKGSHPTLYANLKVTLPLGSRVELKNFVGNIVGGELSGDLSLDTGSGDVRLSGFEGELAVDTGSGDVELGTIRGETMISTGSGDVRAREMIGNGEVDTGSGDVEILKAALGRLSVDTGSGDVLVEDGSIGELGVDTGSGEVKALRVAVRSFEADTGSGNVVLEGPLADTETVLIDTGSGDVRILSSQEASFDVELDSGSGDLSVRYEDARLRTSGGREVIGASRGSGGARIRVDTGSGDCVVGPA